MLRESRGCEARLTWEWECRGWEARLALGWECRACEARLTWGWEGRGWVARLTLGWECRVCEARSDLGMKVQRRDYEARLTLELNNDSTCLVDPLSVRLMSFVLWFPAFVELTFPKVPLIMVRTASWHLVWIPWPLIAACLMDAPDSHIVWF